MKGFYSDSWILYSEFFVPLLRFKPSAEMGSFGSVEPAFTLLRQNAPPGTAGMNSEKSPPKLARLRAGKRRRAYGYGEFRHPYQDAPRGSAGRLHS
jgi:hypothetical protein